MAIQKILIGGPAALDVILGSPVITANTLKSALGVSFPAANTAIAELEAANILKPTGKHGRSRAFVAREVIARLDRSSAASRKAGQARPPVIARPLPFQGTSDLPACGLSRMASGSIRVEGTP